MRHAVYGLCLLFATTGISHAQAKPNTLTPKEIADGWILLFDGETTFGWSIAGEVAVKDGLLVIGGTKAASASPTTVFGECELQFECEVEGKGEPRVSLYPAGNWAPMMRGVLGFDDRMGWSQIGVSLSKVKESKNRVKAEIEMKGPAGSNKLVRAANGLHVGSPVFRAPEGCTFLVRDIKLRPTGAQTLFNGKELTGWKEFPGRKSKFSVTDKGEINVKNGNGDLQTVGKYKDFVLQLEAISNGKHLNSGIFFRCKDGEYQNGYEAQILNTFKPEPTQKYLIEEYDPKTNKLIGKKEMKYTAVDYGTGAIYRRQPARKQMSKDGEWFAMTIVAHGNHFATWVNGVQVVDWTDNRPKSDNPRNGCRLEAGHISIQGHDPTTDLSFRNIRIAEFK